MGRNYSNKNLTELELGNIEFYLNNNCYLFIYFYPFYSIFYGIIYISVF